MEETVDDADCRFTLPELTVVVVAVSNIELISSTVLEASLAVLAFSVALSCFSLASLMSSLAASILSSGLEVDPGDGVVDAGAASHSSPMVAAPEVTDLKQYSLLGGAPSLQYQCQYRDHNTGERVTLTWRKHSRQHKSHPQHLRCFVSSCRRHSVQRRYC